MVKLKSKLLAHCQQCATIYEVEGLQSHRLCKRCRPIKRCAHGVEVTEPCRACRKVHSNPAIRVM